MLHFQITVKEIPNQWVKRMDWKKTYEITASNATEAKQKALDKFGDFSQIESCFEFDPNYPPTYIHSDDQ